MLFTLFSSYVQSGGTPLWAASFDAHQQCMQLLIDAGGIINVPTEVSVSSFFAHCGQTSKYAWVILVLPRMWCDLNLRHHPLPYFCICRITV